MLGQNLKALNVVIHEMRGTFRGRASSQTSAASLGLTQILGDFKDTLDECWKVLEKKKPAPGAVANLRWCLLEEREVNRLRDRIASHNIKVLRLYPPNVERAIANLYLKLSIALGSWNL